MGSLALRGLPAGSSGKVEIAFRPHVVSIAEAGAALDGSLARLEGVVSAREFLGEFIRYSVKVGAAEIVADQAHYTGARTYAPGDTVSLGIQPAQIRILPA